MSRVRIILTWVAFGATFLWVILPEVEGSPAAIWPSVLAVGLAFVTRDIYISLFLGALAGSILLREGNVFTAFLDLFTRYLLPALADPWNASVLVFTLLMGGFVEILSANQGMSALAELFTRGKRDRRRSGMSAYFLGWMLFFDGLANSMLVGKAMRPVTDQAGMSREKLSFIVDSTASPIAGFALISTWVAYEMNMIGQGFENIGDPQLAAQIAPYQLLVQSLPYRFYNYFLLLIVFLVIWLARDMGPMLAAETRTFERRAGSQPYAQQDSSKWRALLALIPLVVLIVGVFGGLFAQGGGLGKPLTMANVIEAFGNADAAAVFVCSTAFAIVVALVLSGIWRAGPAADGVISPLFEGMKQMFLPALVLVFAWTLNGVIAETGAADYLVSLVRDGVPGPVLPAMVFVLAAVVSFSSGTSWGTIAIVMPLMIPVAAELTGLTSASSPGPILIATIGAVLAGAVFGDHCSPISDTTLVSAISSECSVMDHVRTQMPYAMSAALIAVALGYGPAGWEVSPWLLLVLGAIACWLTIRFLGRAPKDCQGFDS